jgi:DNA-binding PadR family transcriptional regulator
MISNKEAVLLGLVLEKPKHAYEVEKDIEERDMKYWTEISMSSVYKLLARLEERDLLESEVSLSEKNVAQKIYTVTGQGKKVFKEKIKELLSAWRPSIHPIDISLANLHRLNKKETVDGLNKYKESLDKMIKCYLDLEGFLTEHKCPPGNIQLATRRIYMLRGERKWLSKFMEDYKNEK